MWQDAKNIYHLFIAVLANIWYGFPSRKLIVIGVTGTDGKTTTVNAIFHILKSAGMDVSMISTTGAVINGKDYDVGFHVTTPSSWAIQRFIKQAVAWGPVKSFPPASAPAKPRSSDAVRAVGSPPTFATPSSKYMVLELTSHALDQYRDWGINYEVGVLTNITNEHLDYHKTYEKYVKAKTKLLQKSKISILNKDDRSYALLSSKFKVQSSKLLTYGLKNKADFMGKDLPSDLEVAEFNKYNLLAATATCKSVGIDDEEIRKAVKSFQPPVGRGEIVYHEDFDVMIDFAHTPNAFEQVLPSIKRLVKGRVIHVFGSAGERDSKKRPEMGKISAKYSDIIILTAEDPRSESINEINKQIIEGIEDIHIFRHAEFNSVSRAKPSQTWRSEILKPPKGISHFMAAQVQDDSERKYLIEIPDRQEAINTAIKIAEKGDLVLLTGKAHEKSMNYGKGEKPWNEHEAVKEALKHRVKA